MLIAVRRCGHRAGDQGSSDTDQVQTGSHSVSMKDSPACGCVVRTVDRVVVAPFIASPSVAEMLPPYADCEAVSHPRRCRYQGSALPLRHRPRGTVQSPFCQTSKVGSPVPRPDDITGLGEVEEPLRVVAVEVQAAVADVGIALGPGGGVELVHVDAVQLIRVAYGMVVL